MHFPYSVWSHIFHLGKEKQKHQYREEAELLEREFITLYGFGGVTFQTCL